jgi:branched-chain amino acid transport system permease protein
MTTFLQLVVVGISTGSVFAIVGMSLVLVYRATGIVNFAQGVFAVLGGLLTYSLSRTLPLPLAAVLATLATGFIATLVALVAVGIRGHTSRA